MSKKTRSILLKGVLPIALTIVTLTIVFFAIRSLFDNRASWAAIERFWNNNREALDQFVSGEISEKKLLSRKGGGIIKDIFIKDYGDYEGDIEFDCGGCGLSTGPSTYVGFIYSVSGEPDPLSWGRPDWEVEEDGMYVIEGNRYKLKEKRLDDHWFIYEEHMD